jgi:putative nucleotidyltransferase with HDIG domain
MYSRSVSSVSSELLELCERMPAFPASVQKVITLTSDIDSSPKDLVKVIDHDPVLTMKILKVANSAYFGLSRRIVSINHAVVYLGLNTVKHVALAIAAIGALPSSNEAKFDMDDFLLHSLTTAVLTRSLAREMNIPEVAAANLFVTGLLHDIGQVVFAQFKPADFLKCLQHAKTKQIPLYEAEDHILGNNHAELGAVLCETWSFPEDLVAAIRAHHMAGTGKNCEAIRKCLFVANLLAARVNSPTNAPTALEEDDLPPWVFRTFGNDFDSMLGKMNGLQSDLQQATSLLQVGRG